MSVKNIFILLLFLSMVGKADDCPICLRPMHKSEIIQHLCCQHQFHSHCIATWMKSKHSCPSCRSVVGLHSEHYRVVEHDRCIILANDPHTSDEQQMELEIQLLIQYILQAQQRIQRQIQRLLGQQLLTPEQQRLQQILLQAQQVFVAGQQQLISEPEQHLQQILEIFQLLEQQGLINEQHH